MNSVSQLCLYIAEAALLGSRELLKNLAAGIASVLAHAVKTRRRFFERYNQHKSNEGKIYEEEHCYGTGIMNAPLHDWLAEANRTGEIFPGRPEVRLRIDFSTTSHEENTRSCQKHYSASSTHSPGIFTVQCACENPKLLSLSIMQRCEGISTALYVLLYRSKRLQRVCYYDNGCKMGKSVLLRVPWVMNSVGLYVTGSTIGRTHAPALGP